jgi:hypothetical protein
MTIRPKDCSGFPHFVRTDFLDQVEVYSENLHRCPATLAFVEKLEEGEPLSESQFAS